VSRGDRILVGISVALSVGGVGTAADTAVHRRALVYERNEAVIVARIDGTRARPLVHGWSPRISPDGRWIAFVRCAGCKEGSDVGRVDLWVVATRGGRARRLARRVDAVTWAPDSRTLVAEHRAGPLRVVTLDGRVRTLVPGTVFGSDVSPDGRNVLYSRRTGKNGTCGSHADVYRVPIGGGASRQLTHDARSGFAVWGRPGIAFAHETAGCGVRTIWFMRPDGSGLRAIVPRLPRELTHSGYYGLNPVGWLPNGRLLAAISAEFRNEAVVVDVRKGLLRRLGVPVDTVSRDGRWILGTASGAEYPFSILIAPVGGGPGRTIARGKVCCPDWNR
jgi:hypothetical protein